MQGSSASFEFGSVSGSAVGMLVFFFICGTAGFVIYVLLRHPRFRRVEARQAGKTSRIPAMMIGGGIGIGLFLLVYFTSINGFYTLSVEGEALRLHYALPSRTYTLPRANIANIDRVAGNRSAWRLRIETRDGSRYLSAQDTAADVDRARQALRALIRPSSY
jgi:hypothetical protein